jgi:hypothetical protein
MQSFGSATHPRMSVAWTVCCRVSVDLSLPGSLSTASPASLPGTSLSIHNSMELSTDTLRISLIYVITSYSAGPQPLASNVSLEQINDLVSATNTWY